MFYKDLFCLNNCNICAMLLVLFVLDIYVALQQRFKAVGENVAVLVILHLWLCNHNNSAPRSQLVTPTVSSYNVEGEFMFTCKLVRISVVKLTRISAGS